MPTAFLTWNTLDHLSVLVAALLALPTVVAAALATRYSRQAIQEARADSRERRLADLIVHVSAMRGHLEATRLQDADEEANVVSSLLLTLPAALPHAMVLAGADPLHNNPAILIQVADDALDELRREILLNNPQIDPSTIPAMRQQGEKRG